MKRLVSWILCALMVLCAEGAVAQSDLGHLRIKGAEFAPAEVMIGDHFWLEIDVEVDDAKEGEPVQVAFPAITPEFTEGRIELLEERPTDTVGHAEGVWQLRKRYRLTSFEPAEYSIDSLGVLWYDGVDLDTVFTASPLRLKVEMMPVDTAQKTIYDIKQPLKTPLVVEEFSGYVAWGLVVVLALISAIYLIATRTRKAKAEVQESRPKEAPHIVAIRRLEMLSTQKLWQNGDYKQYYTRLTDILRDYLDGRYGVGAMEMTTDEIVAAIKGLELTKKQVSALGDLLREADLVKFAKHTPDVESNEASYYTVYYIVEETKEVAEEIKAEVATGDVVELKVEGREEGQQDEE